MDHGVLLWGPGVVMVDVMVREVLVSGFWSLFSKILHEKADLNVKGRYQEMIIEYHSITLVL